MTDARYTMGIDLGQTRNYTAMVVMERVWKAATPQEFIASGTRGYQGEHIYTLVRTERLSLGTSYPRVVEWVRTVAKEYGDQLATIVIDATGVGSAVFDALQRADLGKARLVGVVITGNQASAVGRGATVTRAGFYTVSRAELLTGLQMAVQSGWFQVDRPKCREWDALRRELSVLRLEGKSGKQQDDLAFGLALVVWWGVRATG